MSDEAYIHKYSSLLFCLYIYHWYAMFVVITITINLP